MAYRKRDDFMKKAIAILLVVFLFSLVACTSVLSSQDSNMMAPTSEIEERVPVPTTEQNIEASTSFEPSLESISSLEELDSLESIIRVDSVDVFSDKGVLYKIRYKSDDCEVVGYIAAPIDYLEKKYPVLIWNRGGNQEFGKLKEMDIAMPASMGFVVLASQYRGNDGGTGKEQFGGDDVNDVIKLIDISTSFEFVQSGGVYMAGHSRGGMMTYMACRIDDRIKAAAVGAGISDSFAMYEMRSDMKSVYQTLVGGTPETMEEEYRNRSAVRWADEINVPLLIVHGGEMDSRVNTAQSENMAEQLEIYGKEYKLILYEKADHSLQDTGWYEEMAQWFHEHPLKE